MAFHLHVFFLSPLNLRYTFSVIENIQKWLEILGFCRYFDFISMSILNGLCQVFSKDHPWPGQVSQRFFFQPSHGASLQAKTGLRQLFIANCRKRVNANAFKTLSKPGCLFKEWTARTFRSRCSILSLTLLPHPTPTHPTQRSSNIAPILNASYIEVITPPSQANPSPWVIYARGSRLGIYVFIIVYIYIYIYNYIYIYICTHIWI